MDVSGIDMQTGGSLQDIYIYIYIYVPYKRGESGNPNKHIPMLIVFQINENITMIFFFWPDILEI